MSMYVHVLCAFSLFLFYVASGYFRLPFFVCFLALYVCLWVDPCLWNTRIRLWSKNYQNKTIQKKIIKTIWRKESTTTKCKTLLVPTWSVGFYGINIRVALFAIHSTLTLLTGSWLCVCSFVSLHFLISTHSSNSNKLYTRLVYTRHIKYNTLLNRCPKPCTGSRRIVL